MNKILKKLAFLFGESEDKQKLTEIKNKHFSELTFTVVDLETSGLDTNKDKILSFGAIKIIEGSIWINQSLEVIFKQTSETNNESAVIHGLLKQDISTGDSKLDGLKVIRDFIGKSIVVGHHVDFDYLKLSIAMEKYYGWRLDNLKLDTAELAIRLEKGALASNFSKGEYGLDELCKRYGIETHDRHTSPGDAFITAQLLLKLVALAEAKGMNTVGQLLEKRKRGLV